MINHYPDFNISIIIYNVKKSKTTMIRSSFPQQLRPKVGRSLLFLYSRVRDAVVFLLYFLLSKAASDFSTWQKLHKIVIIQRKKEDSCPDYWCWWPVDFVTILCSFLLCEDIPNWMDIFLETKQSKVQLHASGPYELMQ